MYMYRRIVSTAPRRLRPCSQPLSQITRLRIQSRPGVSVNYDFILSEPIKRDLSLTDTQVGQRPHHLRDSSMWDWAR